MKNTIIQEQKNDLVSLRKTSWLLFYQKNGSEKTHDQQWYSMSSNLYCGFFKHKVFTNKIPSIPLDFQGWWEKHHHHTYFFTCHPYMGMPAEASILNVLAQGKKKMEAYISFATYFLSVDTMHANL